MIDYELKKTDNVKDSFSSLWDIVKCLRDPKDGCPWDKEQMPKDIIRSMQGEIYEYIDALTDGDKEHQSEELGDVFLNLFLLAEIHDQNGDFSINNCILDACEKYIRRHPHVFSNVTAETPDQVIKNWQDIKKNVEGRKEDENNFFSNIERNAPELERCYKISKKAAKVGFEWPTIEGVYNKVYEELEESKEADNPQDLEEELGDVLFTVVNLCRHNHIKPQDALNNANTKFINRFNTVYQLAKIDGKNLEDLSAQEYEDYWKLAKNKLCKES